MTNGWAVLLPYSSSLVLFYISGLYLRTNLHMLFVPNPLHLVESVEAESIIMKLK